MKQVSPIVGYDNSTGQRVAQPAATGHAGHIVTVGSLSLINGPATGSLLLLHPLWRRVLGLRVLVALPIVMWLQKGALDWLHQSRVLESMPSWLTGAQGLFAGTCTISLLFAAGFAIQDIAVCLMPPGPFRKIVLLGEHGQDAREAVLSNDVLAWKLLVVPTLLPFVLLAFGGLMLIAYGATPAMSSALVHLLGASTRWLILASGLLLTLLLRR